MDPVAETEVLLPTEASSGQYALQMEDYFTRHRPDTMPR